MNERIFNIYGICKIPYDERVSENPNEDDKNFYNQYIIIYYDKNLNMKGAVLIKNINDNNLIYTIQDPDNIELKIWKTTDLERIMSKLSNKIRSSNVIKKSKMYTQNQDSLKPGRMIRSDDFHKFMSKLPGYSKK